jgi:hypothetical protein
MRMPRVFISCHHYKPHTHALTGLNLDVQFDGGSAEVSMLEMPQIPEREQEPGIRAAILRLGKAIVEAAQDPQGIIGSPPPRQ